ncbi:hypothetical protein F53441_1690 [Fusarium austroafricanum]|uniref:Uncharacterized protein n=1 Tax=Fusarium austroafricanum TaxID=2364996 RepID=A0A8H4P1Y7_9HYPO|nr:hypothetical protein F53441_1690 [Fusarium austroafricanum]
MFNGQKVTARFNASNLTDTERNRFMKAFLLYELNCRVKTSSAEIESMLPRRELDATEEEAIRCVNSYVCSLYGAMFAQCGGAWLLDQTSLETGLLFPDTFYFNHEIYASDMGQLGHARLGYVREVENKVEAKFARFGLRPFIEFLGYDMSDLRGKQDLKMRLKDWYSEQAEYSHKSGVLCSTERNITSHTSPIYSQLSSEANTELQRNIYRQRAWVFFDNRRFYSKGSAGRPIFPTQSFLNKEPSKQVWVEGWFDNPRQARALRRSKRWHDDLCASSDSTDAARIQ